LFKNNLIVSIPHLAFPLNTLILSHIISHHIINLS